MSRRPASSHDQLLREELTDVQHRFNERKLVDRAKGILMRVRNISEDEAYLVLRTRGDAVASSASGRSHNRSSTPRAMPRP